MSYTYARRKRLEEIAPQKEPAAQQPSIEALRSGAAQPTAEQMGHRVDLPDAMRTKMENAFGADLSAVKLYESEAVADAGANAITQGANIAFAPGMLDFTSFGGQALLGHELSHVVSQARGEVAGGGFLNDRALESRADREGAMAAAGQQIAAPAAAMSSVSAAPAAAPMQASKKEDKENKKFGKLVGKKDKEVKSMVDQYDAKQADMIAAMKEQGFSEDEIQAQLMFQRVNDSKGMLDRYQAAQGAIIEGSHVTDEHAKDKKAFKFGRGVFTKKGIAKRAAREDHLINDILVGDQEVKQADEMAKSIAYQNQQPERDKAALDKAMAAQQGVEADKSTGFLAGQMRIGAHHNVNEAAKKYQSSLHDKHRWGYRQKREEDIKTGLTQGIIDSSAKKKQEALDAETVKLKSENFTGEMHGGALNQVYKFKQGGDQSEKGGYFKPKTDDYGGSTTIMKNIGIQRADSGKTADYDPRLTDREIAFSVLGKMLGSSVALESRHASMQDSDLTGEHFTDGDKDREFAIGKGDSGVMMEEAKGDSWDRYNWDFFGYDSYSDKVMDTNERFKISKKLDQKPSADGASLGRKAFYKPREGSPVLPTAQALMTDDEQEKFRKDSSLIDAIATGDDMSKGATVGERVAAAAPDAKMKKKSTNDFGEVERSVDKGYYQKETIDAANPDFQRQMNELFLLDTLTGHADRHGDNFKVDQTDDDKGGKKVSVKAIDNDLTFGQDESKFGKHNGFYTGLPEQMQIDAKMAKNIRGMTKEALETSLGHLLKKEEIDALWKKFQMMNEYIGEMEKKNLLVDEWNDETSKRELQMAEGLDAFRLAEGGKKKHSGNTYYQKMLLTLELASKGKKAQYFDL